jgi:hypothetical protein
VKPEERGGVPTVWDAWSKRTGTLNAELNGRARPRSGQRSRLEVLSTGGRGPVRRGAAAATIVGGEGR